MLVEARVPLTVLQATLERAGISFAIPPDWPSDRHAIRLEQVEVDDNDAIDEFPEWLLGPDEVRLIPDRDALLDFVDALLAGDRRTALALAARIFTGGDLTEVDRVISDHRRPGRHHTQGGKS